jgi:hypothetical protein
MSQTVRGVIARSKGQPVELVDIIIPDPGPGEVVVAVHACGVCHTDLTYREGGINDSYPFLLGHEAAGVVESIGEGVTQVAAGDFVILNWRAVCGECRACKRGRPWYCFNTFNATQKMTLTDGTELTPALGVGAFADKTLVHQGQCTKVDDEADAAVAAWLSAPDGAERPLPADARAAVVEELRHRPKARTIVKSCKIFCPSRLMRAPLAKINPHSCQISSPRLRPRAAPMVAELAVKMAAMVTRAPRLTAEAEPKGRARPVGVPRLRRRLLQIRRLRPTPAQARL